ncbi:serine/threonine-protein kinase [Streptomyces sp. NPDC091406]|uniref:serine/threonine-protein kinase n=1 Tax=unclassified Streptomyces TaxID=2593676 RepID=UPI0038234E9F
MGDGDIATMILGRYELTRRLGRGGMGEVWSARDHSLDRQIALKFMLPAGGQGTSALLEERFRREARYTARLRHSGVPEIHDVGKLPDGRLYLVMELIAGHTLTELLKEHGSCPVDQALSVAGQIAAVLADAHRAGLVHRDLKPANLMLTPSGQVKVLDFGIAAALASSPQEPRLTGTGGVVGTPGFISPEQALGKPATDRSDLYALGCVLYEILTGRPPFAAGTPVAVAYQHVYEVPRPVAELRPELSDAFADLVMRLLAKEPEARPSAEETVAAVGALVAAAESSARSATVALPLQAARADYGPFSGPEEMQDRMAECQELFFAEDYTRAYEGYRDLTEKLSVTPVATDELRLSCWSLLALCLAKLGRTAEALKEYKSLVPLRLEAFGPADAATQEARLKFASLLGQCGRYAEAYEEANLLRVDLQAHRPEDPRIAEIDDFIARLHQLRAAARRRRETP